MNGPLVKILSKLFLRINDIPKSDFCYPLKSINIHNMPELEAFLSSFTYIILNKHCLWKILNISLCLLEYSLTAVCKQNCYFQKVFFWKPNKVVWEKASSFLSREQYKQGRIGWEIFSSKIIKSIIISQVAMFHMISNFWRLEISKR